MSKKEEILIIDNDINTHIDDYFVVHPEQLKYLNKINIESFDVVKINNTPSSLLSHKVFFHLHKLLRKNGRIEILVSQKITVLQDLDAEEIEANSKLGGFSTIDTRNYERFVKIDGIDSKVKSLLITIYK